MSPISRDSSGSSTSSPTKRRLRSAQDALPVNNPEVNRATSPTAKTTSAKMTKSTKKDTPVPSSHQPTVCIPSRLNQTNVNCRNAAVTGSGAVNSTHLPSAFMSPSPRTRGSSPGKRKVMDNHGELAEECYLSPTRPSKVARLSDDTPSASSVSVCLSRTSPRILTPRVTPQGRGGARQEGTPPLSTELLAAAADATRQTPQKKKAPPKEGDQTMKKTGGEKQKKSKSAPPGSEAAAGGKSLSSPRKGGESPNKGADEPDKRALKPSSPRVAALKPAKQKGLSRETISLSSRAAHRKQGSPASSRAKREGSAHPTQEPVKGIIDRKMEGSKVISWDVKPPKTTRASAHQASAHQATTVDLTKKTPSPKSKKEQPKGHEERTSEVPSSITRAPPVVASTRGTGALLSSSTSAAAISGQSGKQHGLSAPSQSLVSASTRSGSASPRSSKQRSPRQLPAKGETTPPSVTFAVPEKHLTGSASKIGGDPKGEGTAAGQRRDTVEAAGEKGQQDDQQQQAGGTGLMGSLFRKLFGSLLFPHWSG